MPTRRSREFCRALHQEIGDDPRRWTTITAVADRLGIDQDKAKRWRPNSTRRTWCGWVAAIASLSRKPADNW